MKKKVLAMALLVSMTVGAQQKWTLKDCIDYAMQNNLSMKMGQLKILSAAEDRKQSKAELLPSLTATTNQSVGYEPWMDAGNGVSVSKSYYSGTYGVNARWTLWNGNQNRNQLKSDKITEQQTQLDYTELGNTIQEQIAKLYVQILYTSEALDVSKESLEASKKNEERGRQMLEVGSISKAELAQLTAQRATDEYNVVETETNLTKYKVQLKQLLELDSDKPFDVMTPKATDEQALAPIPELMSVYEQAMLVRPEVKNAELEVKQADLQMKIARGGYMPTVSLTAGVGTSTSSRNSRGWGEQMKTNFDASAGVGVSIPIFDNRQTKTAVRKANIAREQALLEQQDTHDTLYDTIEDYWLDAKNNQQKFRTAQVGVESEQESYNLLSEQFELGLKNIIELINGKVSLLKAQQSKLQAKYTTILSIQLLNFYKGEQMTL